MRYKEGKLEDQVFENKLFTNAWNAFKPISDLEGILTKFKSRLVKGGYGSSIIIIMSHGGRSTNSIVMEDVKEKNIYRVFVYQFSHNKSPEFIGKPKIFLVQPCQHYGDVELRDIAHNDDDESQMYTDSSVSSKLEKGLIQDVLVSFATTPDQTARRTNKCSCFIQAIKEVFSKSAKQGRTLIAMLDDVRLNIHYPFYYVLFTSRIKANYQYHIFHYALIWFIRLLLANAKNTRSKA
ncbi:unnamed protein product [Allacma fusca]|uniref:Caspase family p20 domain-containing protein n=1 Tax=Allacma fusca TaxID=39272 RepID=A0A8J2KLL1_9HEXA|nr:unnamed protein product [Allacma fusca]